jgi:3-phenylpropionate/cinnamic acid dioxygenase small subunit
MTDSAEIQAYIEISQVKARYCRTLDTKDWAGYADVFTEDFELDTSPAGGAPPIKGRDAAIKYIRSSIDKAKTAHQVHNLELTLRGDEADVVWAMNDRVTWDPARSMVPGAVGHTGYGHYHERYVRKDGRWRIAKSRLSYLQFDLHHESDQTAAAAR